MTVAVKICGVTSAEAIAAAAAGGAAMVGFMLYPPSRRNVPIPLAAALGGLVPAGIAKVAVTVNADDRELAAVIEALRPDFLQLHGNEDAARTAAVRRRFGVPVIKALPVADRADLAAAAAYRGIADRILFDAKPKPGQLPGGNGEVFDWALLRGAELPEDWMLSGGLTPENVAQAVAISGARAVDVSSGVESAPGRKDPGLIAAFLKAAAGGG